MEIVGVVYRDENLDIEQYENFLTEVSKFDIVGQPVFFKEDYLLYRALIKVKNSSEKSKIETLVDKYQVSVC